MNETTTTKSKYKKRSPAAEIFHRLRKNTGAIVGGLIVLLLILLALFSDVIYDYEQDIVAQNMAERFIAPCLEHPFGTDNFGRDMLARIIYGTRTSLPVGFVAVMIALAIGIILGAFAGYFGGVVENAIMRFMDIFAAVPSILMAIALMAVMEASTFSLMLAVGICMATPFVRMIRSVTLTIRNQEYVQAARALGMPGWRIVFLHILPNCVSQLIVQISLRVGHAIITAASLSFLGLGVPLPAPEWGAMLSEARNYIRGYSYLCLYPGLAIMIVVLAFNMFGDGLRDAMDPKLKK